MQKKQETSQERKFKTTFTQKVSISPKKHKKIVSTPFIQSIKTNVL